MKVVISKTAIKLFEKVYYREGKKVLALTVAPILNRANTTPPEDLKRQVNMILDDRHIESMLKGLYKNVGKKFAVDTVKKINAKKDETDSYWDEWYTRYAAERSKRIAKQVLTTFQDNINVVIDRVVAKLTSEGLGIAEISGNLQRELTNEMTLLMEWEARRIAQTEVIGTANGASYQGAKSAGLEGMGKFWMTSGLSRVRDSHLLYESQGVVPMNHEYSPGLEYPGGPNGAPEEVINCRCTIGYDSL